MSVSADAQAKYLTKKKLSFVGIFLYDNFSVHHLLALYSADLKPRPPLKRSRKMREDDEASRAVNGSKESEESKNHEKEDDDGMSN